MKKETLTFDEVSETTLILSTLEGPKFRISLSDFSVTVGWSPTDTIEIERNDGSITIRHLASGGEVSAMALY